MLHFIHSTFSRWSKQFLALFCKPMNFTPLKYSAKSEYIIITFLIKYLTSISEVHLAGNYLHPSILERVLTTPPAVSTTLSDKSDINAHCVPLPLSPPLPPSAAATIPISDQGNGADDTITARSSTPPGSHRDIWGQISIGSSADASSFKPKRSNEPPQALQPAKRIKQETGTIPKRKAAMGSIAIETGKPQTRPRVDQSRSVRTTRKASSDVIIREKTTGTGNAAQLGHQVYLFYTMRDLPGNVLFEQRSGEPVGVSRWSIFMY